MEKNVLSEELPHKYSRVISRGPVLQTVFRDVAAVYNMSSFFRPVAQQPVPPTEPLLTKNTVDVPRTIDVEQLRLIVRMAGMSDAGTKESLLKRLSYGDYSTNTPPKKMARKSGNVPAQRALLGVVEESGDDCVSCSSETESEDEGAESGSIEVEITGYNPPIF